MNNVVLAVDLGGTNLRMSAVGSDGEIFAQTRTSTPKNATPEEFLGVMAGLADECKLSAGADKTVVGMGIGSGGPGSDHAKSLRAREFLRNLACFSALEGQFRR